MALKLRGEMDAVERLWQLAEESARRLGIDLGAEAEARQKAAGQ